MRSESQVAAEFAKADAEHTEACDRAEQTANKRMALLVELEQVRSEPEVVKEPTDVDHEAE